MNTTTGGNFQPDAAVDRLTAAVQASIDSKLNGLGLPAAALAPATRELGWLAGLTERRKPFDAVAHCLCTVPF